MRISKMTDVQSASPLLSMTTPLDPAISTGGSATISNPQLDTFISWWPWVIVSTAVLVSAVVVIVMILLCVRKSRKRQRAIEMKDKVPVTENLLYSITGNHTEGVYANVGFVPDVIPDCERLAASESKKYTYDYIRTIDWKHLMCLEQDKAELNQQSNNNTQGAQETYENIITKKEGSVLDDDANQYQNIFCGSSCVKMVGEDYADITTEQGCGQSHHLYAVRKSDDNDLGIYNTLNHGNRSIHRPKSDDPAYSHMQSESDIHYTLLCGEATMAKPKRPCDKTSV